MKKKSSKKKICSKISQKVDNNKNKTTNVKKKTTYISKKHENRLSKLVIGFALGSIILILSTYAWFIGMKTVNVSAFDVNISAIAGLSLSLTGEPDSWTNIITINEENYKSASYEGNSNSWGGVGLVPMSSVGQINPTTSRMILYKKGSFTTTPGGYRVMATEALNHGAAEADGYVAFDLFIRNLSGSAYYEKVNIKNEEAIYLTPESKVEVVSSGMNEENSGIENSVRVAFAQIGRVKANSDADTIVDITCETAGKVLGICNSRNATIWEPNDIRHVHNAISWYNSSCKKRTGADLTLNGSFGGLCGTIVDGKAVPTYAVSGVIDETDRVDTYDGAEFNGYTSSISSVPIKGKLFKVPNFTDTMKDLEGTERPKFMMLAPNSVTKVRVYVYLEGQDIDNYDFASLGKKISVSFGFTKERFYGEDVEYNKIPPMGPELEGDLQERPKDDSGASLITELCDNPENCLVNGLKKDPYGDVRYIGENPNNYIEFNDELWRIVGVFNTKSSKNDEMGIPRIKIVREPFDVAMSWDSSGTNDEGTAINYGWGINQWGKVEDENGNTIYEGSDLMRVLNGYYIGESSTCTYCNGQNQGTCPTTNNCAETVGQISSTALKMVDDAVWYTGAPTYNSKLSVSTMYAGERSAQSGKVCASGVYCNDNVIRTTEWVGKIGLIYPSDYAYASADASCASDIVGSDSTCGVNNWLHPSNSYYWTITPSAHTNSGGYIWLVYPSRRMYQYDAGITIGVRPSLYLAFDVQIIGGDGTAGNAYRLSFSG